MDESGLDKYFCRKYARALRGELVYGSIRGRRFERVSIIAGQNGHEILAPLQYKGNMQGEFFEKWFEEHLIPSLFDGAVVVMDNASFHRKKRLNDFSIKYNIKIIFLPPYSPELNPIEHFWNWLKKKVSDNLISCNSLDDAIFNAFKVW